jgi:hypothetical protein
VPLGYRLTLIGKLLFQRAVRPAFHPPDVRSGGVPDNAVQPGGEARASLELLEILKGQEKCVLHRIFGILGIAQHLSYSPLKSGHTRQEQFVQFGVIHVDRENCRTLGL